MELLVSRAALVVLATLAACGPSEPGPSAPAPRLAEAGVFRRVVPANTAAAEFLAVLLGDRGPERIVALPEQVDDYSCFDFETGAWAVLPRFSRYTAEALIVLAPDLVVTHAWQAAETTAILRSHGVQVVVLESTESRGYDGIRASLGVLADRLALSPEWKGVLAALDARVAKLRESSGPRSKLRALVYSNDGTGGWTAGAGTTADAMIRLAGLQDAAADAGLKGHVALDFERLITIDPDVIVVGAPSRGEGESATKSVLVGAKELAGISAVRGGRIVVLSGALMSTDSPFLVDAAEKLAAEVDALLTR